MITPKTDRTHAVTVAVDFEPTWLRWSMPDPRGDGTTLRQQAEHAHRLKDRMIRSIEAEGIGHSFPPGGRTIMAKSTRRTTRT